ncbi:hypothetical protein Saso_59820 [Streptomyces asoensis]|uniref:Uncharacterized protein n=1 Tax=Streptomyces asoensis TaxID=249586 RepID=A0ABQ3S879_9ACTN|nr:hypothetical protein GCM10010496_55050 [Streptomyces asoensis]GHI64332.1 hypothetical protein Saso_59820 [Streptomyces asoensis]
MQQRALHGSRRGTAAASAERAPDGYPDRTDEHDERGNTMTGVDPDRLDDQQLMKELETIHRTRHDTLLHGSNDALRAHNDRMAQLEGEYLRRNPRRFVSPGRTREGARERAVGAEPARAGIRSTGEGGPVGTPVGKWGPGTQNGPGRA